MSITPAFHDAIILSIIDLTKEHDINIFKFLKMLLSETNKLLSPGDRNFGISCPSHYVKTYLNGGYSYPFEFIGSVIGPGKRKRKTLYREFLIKVNEYLFDKGEWDEVTWLEMMTYFLFIQSNCHHKGDINSTKLCRNADSFKNFFYESKDAFNPWGKWERSEGEIAGEEETIKKSKTMKRRGEWWVKAFEIEKKELLMFHTLAPGSFLGRRTTTGWFCRGFDGIREGDFIPYGCVLTQLRRNFNLPELSGDYGLGGFNNINEELFSELDKKEADEKDKEKKNRIHIQNTCDIMWTTIGLVFAARWLAIIINPSAQNSNSYEGNQVYPIQDGCNEFK